MFVWLTLAQTDTLGCCGWNERGILVVMLLWGSNALEPGCAVFVWASRKRGELACVPADQAPSFRCPVDWRAEDGYSGASRVVRPAHLPPINKSCGGVFGWFLTARWRSLKRLHRRCDVAGCPRELAFLGLYYWSRCLRMPCAMRGGKALEGRSQLSSQSGDRVRRRGRCGPQGLRALLVCGGGVRIQHSIGAIG